MRRWTGLAALIGVAAVASAPAAMAQEFNVEKPHLNYAAMNKLGWRLSCQAWTFRELSLSDTIDLIHRMGFRYIEMFPGQRFSKDNATGVDQNTSPELIAELKAHLKAANVTPVAFGVVGMGNNEAECRKVFEFAKALGLKSITTEPSEDAVPMIDKLCQEYKIPIAIHNHPQPSHYWNPETVLKVADGRSKFIGSCADTGHWYRSGLNPTECIQQLKGRITAFHFKDLSADKMDAPWGTGVCDAMGMLREAKKQGFRGTFSIEYESTSGQTLVDNVAKCCAFFSKAATELAK